MFLELLLLTGFSRSDQINCNQDMLLQQIGEGIASRLPIVGDNRIAEMLRLGDAESKSHSAG